MKDEKGEFKMIELKDTLYVAENLENLLSVSKMKKAGARLFIWELIQFSY